MKKLSQLKSSGISHGLFATRSAVRMIPSLLSRETDPRELIKNLVGTSVNQFVNEVGELKGSILKAAQILSLYGEYYLPPEVNEVLKKVQSHGHFLSWDKVEPLLSPRVRAEIAIEPEPVAAASIGQVHRGVIRNTGEVVAVKIQYPGVRKAIDLDIKLIKSIFSLSRVLPKKVNLDPVYGEIKRVLLEEMDYVKEANKHTEYAEVIKPLHGLSVPKIYPAYCNESLIVSEFIDGVPLSTLPPMSADEKGRIGELLLELFFREIFAGNLIQTDSHPGNFLLKDGTLYAIDFGACLEYPESDLRIYREMLKVIFRKDRAGFFSLLDTVASDKGKTEINRDLLWDYCLLSSSPLHSQDFEWGKTTLPDEILPLATELVKTATVEVPPHEFLFLDRKILGLFSLLRSLEARFNVHAIAKEFLGR